MSRDYSHLGLDSQLRKIGGLASNHTYDAGGNVIPKTPTLNEVAPYGVERSDIRSFNFSYGEGGTLTLGGTNNGDGLFNLRNSAGGNIVTMGSGGVDIVSQTLSLGTRNAYLYFTSNQLTLESLNYDIRIETDVGTILLAFGTGAAELRVTRGNDGSAVMAIGTAGNLRIRGTLIQNDAF